MVELGPESTNQPRLAITRVEGFDIVRGLCAIGVAIYHVLFWLNGPHLYNLGTYGVYAFFTLSGASMYVAYNRRFQTGFPPFKFFVLRLVRLAPLYSLAVILGLALFYLGFSPNYKSLSDAVLNILLVFGLANPGTTSTVVGGWSIGIEVVFYLMFPIVLSFINSPLCWLAVLVTFVAQHLFINDVLSQGGLDQLWSTYTQPLSFVFYFVAGCAVGRIITEHVISPHTLWIVPLALLMIILASCNLSTPAETIGGPLGVLFSIMIVGVIITSAGLRLTPAMSRVASMLGNLSYGMYIIHPFVLSTLKRLLPAVQEQPIVAACVVVIFTTPLALLLERFYERPIRLYAQRTSWVRGEHLSLLHGRKRSARYGLTPAARLSGRSMDSAK